jgi:hypothetical protein
MSDVACDVYRGGAQTTDCIGDVEIHLSRIRLDRDVESFGETSVLAENLVELVDLRSITMEDLQV